MSSQPRIAYLCSDPGISLHGNKGASVHVRLLAEALERAGLRLDLFMGRADHDGQQSGGQAGLRARVVEPRRGKGPGRELELLAASTAMHAALAAQGPHAAVYERLSLFGIAGLAHAKCLKIPYILEVNAPLWEEAERYRSLFFTETAHALARDAILGAERIMVVSNALAEIICREGVEEERIEVIGNGVDTDSFHAATPAPRPAQFDGKNLLVFVGSLKPWHGIEFLLKAFESCQQALNLGLWVIGDGPLRDKVAAAAARHPERIVYEGPVQHQAIPGILKAADVALAPYPSDAPNYFSPLKVVEAQAAGCRLLASRHRSVTESLRSDAVVEMFAPGNRKDFASALLRLLARQKPIEVTGMPSWDDHAQRIIEILASAGSRSKARAQSSCG